MRTSRFLSFLALAITASFAPLYAQINPATQIKSPGPVGSVVTSKGGTAGLASVAPGAAGTVLTSNGPGNAPSFGPVAGGTATSAGPASTVQLSGGPGSGTTADTTVQVAGDHALISVGPKVNVRDAIFASGTGISGTPGTNCVGVDSNSSGLADNTGAQLSTCAVRNALLYALTTCSTTNSIHTCPVLYFPQGKYLLKSANNTAVLALTDQVAIEGDGPTNTSLINQSPTASLISIQNVFQPQVSKIALIGSGTASTGTLLELFNSDSFRLSNLYITYNAGIGVNMQGSTEKGILRDTFITNNIRAILTQGDTNENQFDSVFAEFNGQVNSACYDENCTNGARASGAQRGSGRATVYLDGDNVKWSGGSVKSTCAAGIRMANFDSEVNHTYFEGATGAGISCMGYSLALGGKIEIGHGLSTFTPSSTYISVDDAVWQPLYVNDPALAQAGINGQHSYTPTYFLFPNDYSFSDCSQSAAIPALLKCQSAQITMQAFSVDGNGYIVSGSSHASNGTVAPGTACTGTGFACRGLINAAITWPAGQYVVEQTPTSGYEAELMSKDHINMIHPSTTGDVCDDTAQASTWQGSPSQMCADIFDGYVPDGYAIPFTNQGGPKYPNALHVVDLGIANGGTESQGHGWIKIALNGRLDINQGNAPLTAFTPYATALTTYLNGNTEVQVVNGALASIVDESAGYHMIPQNQLMSALVSVSTGTGQAVSTENYEPPCTYTLTSSVTSTAPPTQRTCDGQKQFYFGSKWLNTPGNAQLTSEVGSNSVPSDITLPAAAAGTVVKTGVYDPACTAAVSGSGHNLGSIISGLTLALGYSSISVQLSSGFPAGVYYGLGQYSTGGAVDPNTGNTPIGWVAYFCNSDPTSSHVIPAGTTAQWTQVVPGLLNY